MTQIYAGARALALAVAIIGAFVTVPYLATILIVLGAISVLQNSQEDNLRTYLIAIVLLVGAKELAAIPGVGSYLASIFQSIGVAAFGASALAVLLSIWRLTTAAFASKVAQGAVGTHAAA